MDICEDVWMDAGMNEWLEWVDRRIGKNTSIPMSEVDHLLAWQCAYTHFTRTAMRASLTSSSFMNVPIATCISAGMVQTYLASGFQRFLSLEQRSPSIN